MQETKEIEKKLIELFTKNQVTLRFVSEFVKRFKDSSDDEPIQTHMTSSGEALFADNRFYGIMRKGSYGKKIINHFSASIIYELCLTFKQAGIKLSDVVMGVSEGNSPSLFICERIPFDVMLAPSEVIDPFDEETEDDDEWDDSANQSLTTEQEE